MGRTQGDKFVTLCFVEKSQEIKIKDGIPAYPPVHSPLMENETLQLEPVSGPDAQLKQGDQFLLEILGLPESGGDCW